MSATDSNLPQLDAAEILDGIRAWVEIESPSHDAEAVNRLVDLVERQYAALDATIERTPGTGGFGDILQARTSWGDDEPGILVLSHLDTVHPHGTIERLSYRREGDQVFGPGIYDMKGGAYLAHYAFQHCVRQGRTTPLPITFLLLPDEEVGSPTSTNIIEAAAKRAKYVLVTEPAREGGKIVTARKGSARFVLTTKGRPAHSGSRHQDGRSAIREMARLILAIEDLTDYERGITANVGLIDGGTGVNVVPASCTVEVDTRIPDLDAAQFITDTFAAFKPADPDVELIVEGGLNRPPFEKNDGIQSLFDQAKDLAAEIGFELIDMKTGGGSDGNFTANLGIPTLDGLGVDGAGAHTEHEHLYYSSLVPRTKLMLRLFETLS